MPPSTTAAARYTGKMPFVTTPELLNAGHAIAQALGISKGKVARDLHAIGLATVHGKAEADGTDLLTAYRALAFEVDA